MDLYYALQSIGEAPDTGYPVNIIRFHAEYYKGLSDAFYKYVDNIDLHQPNEAAALMIAVLNEDDEILEMLVESGADPALYSGFYNGDIASPLSFAIKKKNTSLIRYLLDHTDEKKLDHWIITDAIQTGDKEIIELLLSKVDLLEIQNQYQKHPDCGKLCSDIIEKYIWKSKLKSDKRLAVQASTSGDLQLPKEIWELILFKKSQMKLCQDLNTEKYKGALLGFVEILGFPVSEKITKSELCSLINKYLSFERFNQELNLDHRKIQKIAFKLGIDANQSTDKILSQISSIV